MARFFPIIDKNFHSSDGEQLVYESLKNGLSDQYVVFHSFTWLGNEKQRWYLNESWHSATGNHEKYISNDIP